MSWKKSFELRLYDFKLSLLGAWIAGATIEKNSAAIKAFKGVRDTRLSYIVITITAFAVSIVIYLLNLFNIVNMAPLKRFNTDFLVR